MLCFLFSGWLYVCGKEALLVGYVVRKHCTQNLCLSCLFINSVYRFVQYTESMSELLVY